ncbi:leucyl/phenylalanyl-tRNA--protein transferase [Acidovorax sp. BL-A-41-H1]|uniref:leucyl/phenylalanyl-tRNA--protein transferase n=1 Tax=Acidovorax sp. BL-A-41-H1 TaxID=3421102 RepID=UPI003F7AF6D3
MSAPLPWLEPDDALPAPDQAWDDTTPAPGLLAAGGSLSVDNLRAAYSQGTFPWYSTGQPIWWWAPDPRMVLPVAEFRLHRSLKQKLKAFRHSPRCEIRVDHAFREVIAACAGKPREGQNGTWIVPDMVAAYTALHTAGYAHSVETWVDGELVGGLYCVALGHAVFGESMFAHATDASKIALAALVCLCRREGADLVDCQQNTQHLASLGAREISRTEFLAHTARASRRPPMQWQFEPIYWNELLPATVTTA